MRSVTQGGIITFTATFVSGDPTDVSIVILRDNVNYAGPFTLEDGEVVRVAEGIFKYTWIAPVAAPLVTYKARFTGTVDTTLLGIDEIFEVISTNEIQVSSLLSPPNIRGSVRVSPLYSPLGQGLTDRIFLLGHADGLELNDPYQVRKVQDAINLLQANPDSPLLRALLEAYYAGARDIYLVAAAPMNEYIADTALRNETLIYPSYSAAYTGAGYTFYNLYNQRLAVTYQLLTQWDVVDIVVPVEASFYGTDAVDMLTPLVQHCADSFTATGRVRMGILGSHGDLVTEAIDEMVADTRLETQGSSGKFVSIIAGDVTFNFPELEVAHRTTAATVAAGLLATQDLNRGLTYLRLPNVISPTYANPSKAQIRSLAEAKINPVIRNTGGRRRSAFETVVATDNTVARDGSDFWSMVQLRLSSRVIASLQDIASRYIGSIKFNLFKEECQKYLASLSTQGVLRGFSVNITRSEINYYKIIVDVYLKPYFGVREIYFNVEVGPNE